MKHRKTIVFLALALLALLPLAAIAEPDRGQRGRGPGRGMFPPPGYLDLTDEQIEAARAIRESTRGEMQALREEKRTLHEQLKALLDGDSPDATEVGELTIELHGLRQQTRAILEAAEAEFAALLTSEQLEKWENFKELRQNRRGPRHRRGPGSGGGAGFGGGDFDGAGFGGPEGAPIG